VGETNERQYDALFIVVDYYSEVSYGCVMISPREVLCAARNDKSPRSVVWGA